METSPEDSRDSSDVGEEVQRRFRYQAAYAAEIAVGLLREEAEFDKIYCEHHDDILVRRKDCKYLAVQVKSRQQGKDAFKANDEEITKSIMKFVRLHLKYPGAFRKFVIASSIGFWNEKKNGSNLFYLRDLALDDCGIRIVHHKISSYHNKLKTVSKKSGVDDDLQFGEEDVESVLARLELQSTAAIEDVEMRLQRLISGLDLFKDRTVREVKKAAEALIDKTSKAGSLCHEFDERDIFRLFEKPEEFAARAAIEGKLITRDVVQEIVKGACGARISLKGGNYVAPEDLPAEMMVGRKKMAAGEVKSGNIRLTGVQKNAAEHLLVEWLHRYDGRHAQERYDQVALVVDTECGEAFSESYNKEVPFGERMLANVRGRLRNRYKGERELFFDCRYEHLMGFVGILTEDCTIWWSDSFSVES